MTQTRHWLQPGRTIAINIHTVTKNYNENTHLVSWACGADLVQALSVQGNTEGSFNTRTEGLCIACQFVRQTSLEGP